MATGLQSIQRQKKQADKRAQGKEVALENPVLDLASKGRGAKKVLKLTSKSWRELGRGDFKGLEVHDLVTEGVRVEDAKQLMRAYTIIGEKDLFGVLGITARTMQRRAASTHKTLDPNASDRALRLVSVTNQAIEVLGSQQAAERWLSSPAMGLDQRKPIDLLRSSEGTELVKTLLTRMDFGVYA